MKSGYDLIIKFRDLKRELSEHLRPCLLYSSSLLKKKEPTNNFNTEVTQLCSYIIVVEVILLLIKRNKASNFWDFFQQYSLHFITLKF